VRRLQLLVFILTLPTIVLYSAQKPERFESGPEKGFLMSPTEHIIVELPEPLNVRSVGGSILDPHRDGLPDVVFEIRDESGTIRAGVSDSHGRFHMRGVPNGTYRFKATKNGFQSIVGTIVVTKRASRKTTVALQMNLGV
jgi:hypothetical protein